MIKLYCAIKLSLRNRIIFLLFLCLLDLKGQAQKEDRIWCFPDHAGIDFNNLANPDTFTSAVHSHAFENQSSISDTSGNLFCYVASTDLTLTSLYVWDRNHNIMPNGSNLKGHPNFTSILLPYPNQPNKIVLLHLGHSGIANTNELFISIINKTMNSGFGDLELRDSLVYSGALSSYKLAVVRHSNGRDWWILICDVTIPTFIKFLLTANGIDSIGSQNFPSSTVCANYGTILFSRDGSKLLNLDASGCINVFDFDRCSGQLSNLRDIGEHITSEPYQYFSGAFSPNGNIIYVSAFNLTKVFYQFDLNAPNIQSTKLLINQYLDTGIIQGNTYYNHLLAPDDKIYISRGNSYGPDSDTYFTHHLDVIEYPDSVGLGCHYIQNGFDLGSHFVAGYLPNMAYFGLGAATGSVCDSLSTSIQALVQTKKRINVFPNPATGVVSFGLEDPDDLIVLGTFKDMLGKTVVSSSQVVTGSFDIAGKAPGVYFLQVITKKKKFITTRLMKE